MLTDLTTVEDGYYWYRGQFTNTHTGEPHWTAWQIVQIVTHPVTSARTLRYFDGRERMDDLITRKAVVQLQVISRPQE